MPFHKSSKQNYCQVPNNDFDLRIPLHSDESFQHGIVFQAKVSARNVKFFVGLSYMFEIGEMVSQQTQLVPLGWRLQHVDLGISHFSSRDQHSCGGVRSIYRAGTAERCLVGFTDVTSNWLHSITLVVMTLTRRLRGGKRSSNKNSLAHLQMRSNFHWPFKPRFCYWFFVFCFATRLFSLETIVESSPSLPQLV